MRLSAVITDHFAIVKAFFKLFHETVSFFLADVVPVINGYDLSVVALKRIHKVDNGGFDVVRLRHYLLAVNTYIVALDDFKAVKLCISDRLL